MIIPIKTDPREDLTLRRESWTSRTHVPDDDAVWLDRSGVGVVRTSPGNSASRIGDITEDPFDQSLPTAASSELSILRAF